MTINLDITENELERLKNDKQVLLCNDFIYECEFCDEEKYIEINLNLRKD